MQFGLFHGDPHPGNIFCLPDGRIAYVDFGNVAELSQQNKAVLIDAVVHAVNNDYDMMAQDFIKLASALLAFQLQFKMRSCGVAESETGTALGSCFKLAAHSNPIAAGKSALLVISSLIQSTRLEWYPFNRNFADVCNATRPDLI